MGEKALSTTQVIVNNIAYPIVPNTFKFTEGFGEYKKRAASAGSGRSVGIFSENAENKMSKISFEMFPTAANIKTIREWKAALDENLIEGADSTTGFSRSFSSAALVNDYEVEIGADTTIKLDWETDPAV